VPAKTHSVKLVSSPTKAGNSACYSISISSTITNLTINTNTAPSSLA
jgi:hypothetical protein